MRTPHALGLLAALAGAGCASSSTGGSGAGCTNLFDGESLTGWTRLGGASVTVEDGVIVGSAVREPGNSFLRTDRDDYGDFDLTLAFNVDAGFNAGVQFRSAQAADTLRFRHQAGNGDRFVRVTAPGTVYGYQAEIDPTPRAWTAELYEEAGRGWLDTFAKTPARRPVVPGRWHRLRIRAAGDRLQTWLDGRPVADLRDTAARQGFIALQVHAVYADADVGKRVRFRDVRLCAR